MSNNPFLNKPKLGPLVLKAPMYDFKDGAEMEAELLSEELCVARIPNTTAEIGYTHHVALVYKNEVGDVFSTTMAQHNGVLKEGTAEHFAAEDKKEQEKEPIPGVTNG